MSNQEFDYQFDILYNNITSNQAPGLDAYEKSVFLTKAQIAILKAYFEPQSNRSGTGFDMSPRKQVEFSSLIKVGKTLVDPSSFMFDPVFDTKYNTKSVELPLDVLFIINERCRVKELTGVFKTLTVSPISYAEYDRHCKQPFSRPYKGQAWRIIGTGTGRKCDIIIGPNQALQEYSIRYVKTPRPIILYSLDGGLTIDSQSMASTCELPKETHEEILQKAVEMAKLAYTENASQAMYGNYSSTEAGAVYQPKTTRS